jgi:hypothetical protein
MRIFQSRMRESTISKQGITQSVAASTSARVTPGPIRSLLQHEGDLALGLGLDQLARVQAHRARRSLTPCGR